MKKTAAYPIALIACLLSYNAAAANNCSVLGVHEPNTNIYDGPTWCENTKLSNLIVRGPLSISHSNVLGTTDISGPVQSKNATFHKVVIHSSLSQQKVILSQKTTVNGDLIFVGVRGKVFVDKSSKVTGKIVNAEVDLVK